MKTHQSATIYHTAQVRHKGMNPSTCYYCNEKGHVQHNCHRKKRDQVKEKEEDSENGSSTDSSLDCEDSEESAD